MRPHMAEGKKPEQRANWNSRQQRRARQPADWSVDLRPGCHWRRSVRSPAAPVKSALSFARADGSPAFAECTFDLSASTGQELLRGKTTGTPCGRSEADGSVPNTTARFSRPKAIAML